MVLEFLSKRYWKQLIAINAVHIVSIGYGVTVGWTAPIIPLLQSAHSPFPGDPITVEQVSWVGSCFSIGGMSGTLLYALIHTYFGKKTGLLMLAIPHLILWSLLWMGDNVYYVYIARYLGGLTGGGIFVIVPLYVADIVDRRIRGSLGSLTMLHINFGLLASYTAGNYLPYYFIPKIMLCLPIAFLALVCLLPETPYCLLRKGKVVEAEKSLMFYRNIPDVTRKTLSFEYEFESLKTFILTEANKDKLSVADFTTPAAIRGLFISIFVMALNQFCGIFAIVTYAGNILEACNTSLDTKYVLILIALINICGNITSFIVVDMAGRKTFLLISTIGVGISLGILGLHSYFSYNEDGIANNSWVPVLALLAFIYSAGLGITNMVGFIIPEVLPAKIRSIGSTISVGMLCFFAFVVLKVYPILLERINVHGTVWISCGVCAISILIIIFIMPETKGKNLIDEDAEKKPRRNAY
ncbi:facilitated trehalose transporter Tret1-like [Armigeres subalbatus]|uniref:facilitated trehalose transporter Tret1-like n=1 Tax=Armigeres subalbatus TaxID=124917 RepID=UPI002ED3171C